jgi:hypothetical protein
MMQCSRKSKMIGVGEQMELNPRNCRREATIKMQFAAETRGLKVKTRHALNAECPNKCAREWAS